MYYKDIKKILQKLWVCDDLISQDDLFDVQELVAILALKIAKKEKTTDDLVSTFPWLFSHAEKTV